MGLCWLPVVFKSCPHEQTKIGLRRIVGCDAGALYDLAPVAFGMFDQQGDFTLLPGRDDFVKVADRASSAGSDRLN